MKKVTGFKNMDVVSQGCLVLLKALTAVCDILQETESLAGAAECIAFTIHCHICDKEQK